MTQELPYLPLQIGAIPQIEIEKLYYNNLRDAILHCFKNDSRRNTTSMFEIKEESGMYYLDASIEESYIFYTTCRFGDKVSPSAILNGLDQTARFSIQTKGDNNRYIVSSLGTVKDKETIEVVLEEDDDHSNYVFSVSNNNHKNIGDISRFVNNVNTRNRVLVFINFKAHELSHTPKNEITANVRIFQMFK